MGTVGTTGGANSHYHTGASHDHTNSHNHLITSVYNNSVAAANTARFGRTYLAGNLHIHMTWSMSPTTIETFSATFVTKEGDGRSSYKEVIWIKKSKCVWLKGSIDLVGSTHIAA